MLVCEAARLDGPNRDSPLLVLMQQHPNLHQLRPLLGRYWGQGGACGHRWRVLDSRQDDTVRLFVAVQQLHDESSPLLPLQHSRHFLHPRPLHLHVIHSEDRVPRAHEPALGCRAPGHEAVDQKRVSLPRRDDPQAAGGVGEADVTVAALDGLEGERRSAALVRHREVHGPGGGGGDGLARETNREPTHVHPSLPSQLEEHDRPSWPCNHLLHRKELLLRHVLPVNGQQLVVELDHLTAIGAAACLDSSHDLLVGGEEGRSHLEFKADCPRASLHPQASRALREYHLVAPRVHRHHLLHSPPVPAAHRRPASAVDRVMDGVVQGRGEAEDALGLG
mmetsp:Transcript_50687/g.158342  ORF Transcript_50687/g.158342 Transcript_50687/m.158342 type:complete len:335 (-) Transcript_50687:691-1695(-)